MKKLLLALVLIVLTISVTTSCRLFGALSGNELLHYMEEESGDGYCVGLSGNYKGEIPSEIVIPSSYNNKPVTSLFYGAFENCSEITSVTIPDTILSIPSTAFKNCTSLVNINIPNSVISIGSGAFENCTSLVNINIPNSIISIEANAFSNTAYYNDLGNWEDDMLYIGKHLIAFMEIISSECEIKDATLTIADNAFDGCHLTSVKIPDSVMHIGNEAFYYCESLTSVTFAENTELTSLESGMFWGCKALKNIEIPASVTSIGSAAFYFCESLESVIFEEGSKLNSIKYDAFGNCCNLTEIILPDSLTIIEEYAFSRCHALTDIKLPKAVKEIGHSAFEKCDNLIEITVDSENKYFRAIEGNLYSRDGKALVQYAIGKSDNSFNVPDSVITIKGGAFSGSRLVSVYLNSVKTIEYEAFNNCDYLGYVSLGFVTTIGTQAFRNCRSLASIEIPDSVTYIEDYAFIGTAIYNNEENWENGVLYIGKHLITANPDLISGSYTIKDGTLTIAVNAFCACESLTSITIPRSVVRICSNWTSKNADINNIYYEGSEWEWENINHDNAEYYPFKNATITYNYVPES